MTADHLLDMVCFGYLADTQLLRVPAYPPANGGTVVDQIAASIAADGPIAAITAAHLGLRVGLIANTVGDDPPGRELLAALDAVKVRHTIAAVPGSDTPKLTVIVDDDGTRTWFASVQQATAQLQVANLHMLADTRMIYADCYPILTSATARAISAANGVPLVLNLGGEPLDDTIVAAAVDRRIAAALTSLDEADAGHAESLATMLLDRLCPDTVVVTLGRLGALARTRAGTYRAAAPPVAVTNTHGAGAAFAAGYAGALLAGADIDTALRAGCESGAAHCTRPLRPCSVGPVRFVQGLLDRRAFG